MKPARAGARLAAVVLSLQAAHPARADMNRMLESTLRIVCQTGNSFYVGSGFVVGVAGDTYLATNQHVIVCARPGEAQKLFILLSPESGVRASVVWSDPVADLAIISATGSLHRPAVAFASAAALAPGAPVIAVGYPAIADKLVRNVEIAVPSVTRGYVSRILKDTDDVRYIEHTAVTNPGNSGGPLYDESGDVVGVVARLEKGSGLAAAVDAAALFQPLQDHGVPYMMAGNGVPTGLSLAILALGLCLLLAAAGVMVATASGRGRLAGHPAPRSPAPVTGGRAARIRILDGALAGMELPILDRVVLGRDPTRVHLVFPESENAVSRRHCEIVYDSTAAAFQVCDLGSRNGTFLVRREGAPRRLAPETPERAAPGDKVLVGSPKNRLVLELA